ncbi:hypothetical protein [Nocardioides lianchengensis]|uniref:Uncharacterized protein n=1 Tax=Nocardioides lianchengensis TaxID=1045774 RepID=A0A1G6PFP0_9ACTN|nr:hypothetical protein [Nocardioides lianchengensis]NYG11841.1 hypothetical protein [Nocardioides lianchengensis]SDC79050.1 hypothetical protein SAMN05421872_1048 [Nocardioides lianchengensis]
MLIPLWLPWAVVAAAVLYAFLAPGEALSVPDLGRRAVAVVAIAVAVGVTVDHYSVSETELYDATLHVTAPLDGRAGYVLSSSVRVLVEERLGQEVILENVTTDDAVSPYEQVSEIEVRAGEGGPVACLELRTALSKTGPPITYTSVQAGACRRSD